MVTISTVNNVVESTGNAQVKVKCLSTDEKPTNVPINSLLLELDTQRAFYFDGDDWELILDNSGNGSSASNGGTAGIYVQEEEPTDASDGALWLDTDEDYAGGNEPNGDMVTSAILYTEQGLTDEQKSQARANIGAGTSDFSGSWNDLTDKPTENVGGLYIPWDENTEGLSYIDDFYHVSDAVLTLEDFVNGYTVNIRNVVNGEETFDFGSNDLTCSDFFSFGFDVIHPNFAPFFLVIPEGSTFPNGDPIEKGVYFLNQSTSSVCTSLTIHGQEVIKSDYIPETIARMTDIPEVPEHTWGSLPDKPFGIIRGTILAEDYFFTADETTKTFVINEDCTFDCESDIEVVYDGAVYFLTGYKVLQSYCFESDELPFSILYQNWTQLELQVNSEIYGEEHCVTVKTPDEIAYLDSSYISNDIARVDHIHSWSELEDKPFGKNYYPAELVYEGEGVTNGTHLDFELCDEDYNALTFGVSIDGSNRIYTSYVSSYIWNLGGDGSWSIKQDGASGCTISFEDAEEHTVDIYKILEDVDVDDAEDHFAMTSCIDETFIPDTIARVGKTFYLGDDNVLYKDSACTDGVTIADIDSVYMATVMVTYGDGFYIKAMCINVNTTGCSSGFTAAIIKGTGIVNCLSSDYEAFNP